MGTSGTGTDANFRSEQGTGSVPPGYTYIPAPPPKLHAVVDAKDSRWTFERVSAYIGSVIGIVVVLVTVAIFFSGMSRDLSDIKSDVKDGNEKLGQLMQQADKNAYDIQSLRDGMHGDTTVARRK
jgi:hypothetical protein